MKLLCIRIPYFNDIEPAFRANGDSIDFIGRIDRRALQHGRDDIVKIHLVCLFLLTSEGIASSTDMMVALPQRRCRILHHEEHSLAKGLCLQKFHDRPELTPCLHRPEADERIKSPFSLLGGMEVQGPRSSGNRRL